MASVEGVTQLNSGLSSWCWYFGYD